MLMNFSKYVMYLINIIDYDIYVYIILIYVAIEGCSQDIYQNIIFHYIRFFLHDYLLFSSVKQFEKWFMCFVKPNYKTIYNLMKAKYAEK